jgi:pimeloyl-ACP methyl ester carboxylesterase
MTKVGVGGGVELNYRDAGTGPILLFHPGFSNNLDLWNWLVAELSPTHRCVTFDPRGHGGSDKPDSDYTLDELARDIEALCQGLDLSDVTLVGHSLGGAVSIASVLDHNEGRRVTRLAMLAPAVPTWIKRPGTELGAPPELFDRLAAGFGASFVPAQLGIADMFFHQTDAVTARWIMEQTLAMPVHIARRLFGALQHIDFTDRLKEVDVPVLVVWGARDQVADPRWLDWFDEQALPGWTTASLPDSGHGSMVDEPGRLAGLLRDFVDA